VISAEAGQQVIERYRANAMSFVPVDQLGEYHEERDTVSGHLQRILNTVDVPRIQRRKFKVVLDSNHGAGSILGQILLRELGCELQVLGEIPNGKFAHPPEPTAQNLQGVAEQARTFGADVVFCQDPDADRLAIIDQQGHYIGEEYTLAITLAHALANTPPAGRTVVTNCSSSRMSADIAAQFGALYQTSAVGEANVTDLMITTNAIYGGEGNGGPIDPRVGYVRDSFAAMAQVLDAMAQQEKSISEIVKNLPRYEIYKTPVAVEREQVATLLERLQQAYPEAATNSQDGLRLDWPDRWILVRPSNTEPIVRAIAEAKTPEAARSLCETTAKLAATL
jgi:phosphomannomutase